MVSARRTRVNRIEYAVTDTSSIRFSCGIRGNFGRSLCVCWFVARLLVAARQCPVCPGRPVHPASRDWHVATKSLQGSYRFLACLFRRVTQRLLQRASTCEHASVAWPAVPSRAQDSCVPGRRSQRNGSSFRQQPRRMRRPVLTRHAILSGGLGARMQARNAPKS